MSGTDRGIQYGDLVMAVEAAREELPRRALGGPVRARASWSSGSAVRKGGMRHSARDGSRTACRGQWEMSTSALTCRRSAASRSRRTSLADLPGSVATTPGPRKNRGADNSQKTQAGQFGTHPCQRKHRPVSRPETLPVAHCDRQRPRPRGTAAPMLARRAGRRAGNRQPGTAGLATGWSRRR
jgi:hypothetical protein